MSGNEDRKLQIELTRVQLEYERFMSFYTLFISVIASLMFTTISVYVPLGVMLNSEFYFYFALAATAFLAIPLLWLNRKMKQEKKRLERDLQRLRREYAW